MVFLAHENFPPEIILLKRKTNFLRPKVFKNVPQSPYIYENDNDEDENFLTFFSMRLGGWAAPVCGRLWEHQF